MRWRGLRPAQNIRQASRNGMRSTQLFRRWSQGLVLTTCLFVVEAVLTRGWRESLVFQWIVGISLAGFFWSHVLLTYARRTTVLLRDAPTVLWANTIVLLVLGTAMMIVTGASFSPLAWLYFLVIIGDALQNRHRGVVVAWASWGLFCFLAIAHSQEWLPVAYTGIKPEQVFPFSLASFLHPLGIGLWYGIIALLLSIVTRWMDHYQQGIEIERQHLRTVEQDIGSRLLELGRIKSELEEERKRWEQERLHWMVQRAQSAKRLADQEAALVEQVRKNELIYARLQVLQERAAAMQASWASQEVAGHADGRQESERDHATALGNARHLMDHQQNETVHLLTQLERTLQTSLRRLGDDMDRLEARQHQLDQAQHAFVLHRTQWVADQTHTVPRAPDESDTAAPVTSSGARR